MSRLKRRKQQAKRIASEKIEPKTEVEQTSGKRDKNEIQPLPKHYKTIVYTFFGIVLVAVITLVIVLSIRSRREDDPIVRYEDLTHISTDIYKVFTKELDVIDLNDDDKEIYDGLDLRDDIYIFIYNPNYEECQDCEEIEAFIQSIYSEEDKPYTFVLMNFNENEEMEELLNISALGIRPVLLHIEGEEFKDSYTTIKSIQLELRK